MVGAGPAFAGTTNASTLTKTGTDASTGSTARATSTVGKTAPGDTINWVLNYHNATGGSALVNLTDPIGANQTFVSGSLRTPPGLPPAWSTNGGGSFTSTEPGSGVNAIRAVGNNVNGSAAQSSFSNPLSSFSAGASQGDGWEALFVGPNIWNVHHHTLQTAAGNTIVDCHVAATGAECPGFPSAGQTVPTTAGTPLGTPPAPGDPAILTAMNTNAAVYNGRIYFPTGISGTTSIGVSCVDTTNNTSCGYTQMGSSTFANGLASPAFAEISGGGQIGSKYYTVGASPGAPVFCFDMSANAPCAGWSNPSSAPGYVPDDSGSGYHSTLDTWGGYLFTDMSSAAIPFTHSLGCIVAATGALCPGFPKLAFSTGSGIDNHSMAPITDASGTVTGICASDQPTTAGAAYRCFSVADGSPLGAEPWGQMVPGAMVGLQMIGDPLLLGTRLYLPYVTAAGVSTYTCWDYSTSSACAGFTPVSSGSTNVQAYTLRQDPDAPDCVWELGNAGTFEVFSATFGGTVACDEGSAGLTLTPSQYYCDGQSGHVTGWKQLQVDGVDPSQYDALSVTITDANGNPIPGWDRKVVPSSQVPIDISSIPYSGADTVLNVQVVIDWGQHPVVQGAAVSATFNGDPVQVCFQTKVGQAKCSVDQSISNAANAVTVAGNGVSDASDGDDSGDATFFLPANAALKGCEADLSIAKTADGTSVSPGGQVMYTLIVTNHGPETATSAKVSDAIPAGLAVISAQPSQGSCKVAGAVDCSLGTILSGGSAQILVTANVASNASGSIVNCATTSAFQSDPNTANNSSCDTITTPSSPPATAVDVQVVKHVDHPAAKLGETLTYTLDVKNNGPGTAPNVTITDTSAIGMRVQSIKPSQGTCSKGVPFTCKLGSLASKKTAKITIRAVPRQTGSEVNSVSTAPGCTSSGSCPSDTNVKNNVSAAKTNVKPYLRLVKTASTHVVKAGKKFTYHLKVSNPTPVTLHDVRVCDRLPLGIAYVSSKPKATLSNGEQCWSFKTLGAHKSKTIKLVVKALPGASGSKTNHATASAKGVKSVKAHRTVRVDPAAKPATPVTG